MPPSIDSRKPTSNLAAVHLIYAIVRTLAQASGVKLTASGKATVTPLTVALNEGLAPLLHDHRNLSGHEPRMLHSVLITPERWNSEGIT